MTTATNMPKLELEIHPCHLLDRGDIVPTQKHHAETCFEQCDAKSEHIAVWGVYRHLPEGGIESIVDCATEEGAEFVAKVLEQLYNATGACPQGPAC